MEEHTCPVCRENFTATHHNQRFCPPSPGEAKSKCAKAYTNAKSRGTLDKLLAEPWTPPAPFDCAYCGERCIPGEGVAKHAAKFCGYDCKAEWHRLHPDGATYRYREGERERSATSRKHREARRRLEEALAPGRPRQWFEGPCRGCGERLVGCFVGSKKAHYCSATCCRRDARHRRRARKRKAFVEEVWRPVLFERDNWTCQLCGDAVNPNLKYPDPMAATVDHIVPLAKGGEHSYANTQLAHALCNSLKSDRESGSMLFTA